MGQALYRTYRSRSFDDVIGQDHITQTLKNSLQSGSVSHAYLFVGPRGVGKTSVARILAYGVNNVDYEDPKAQLDIIEIDAASNRRIDEIRALREKVHIAPAVTKYKVYIIDEVHMLTKEAFNALLKTLEEPPKHVIFILATTEVNKLPDTIISRCVRFTFKPIGKSDISNHLRTIATTEKLQITDDAIGLLAEHSGGSFRDSISLLDQVRNLSGNIDISAVETMLGLAQDKTVSLIVESISRGEVQNIYKLYQELLDQGVNPVIFSSQLSKDIRNRVIGNETSIAGNALLGLLEELLDVPGAYNPESKLELILLTACMAQKPPKNITDNYVEPPLDEDVQKIEPEVASKTQNSKVKLFKPVVQIDTKAKDSSKGELWDQVLDQIKQRNSTLYGVARMAKATHNDSTLILSFKFPFHYKKIDDDKNKALITQIINELGSDGLTIQVVLDEKHNQVTQTIVAQNQKNESKTENLSTITNIFGTSEVLES